MAGYNRGIVATRKLNEKNKARLGRGGDTKIRTVDGQKSHVTAFEAYKIDVEGKAGEEYTKKVGSGTINPYTGMPEYQQQIDYDEFAAMDPNQQAEFFAGWGVTTDEMKYFGGMGYAEEADFARRQRDLATGRASSTYDITQRGLEATKGFAEEGLGLSREFAQEGLERGYQTTQSQLGMQYQDQAQALSSNLETGSRGIGRSIAQGRAGAEIAAGRSGLAMGSATGAFEQQKSELMGASRDLSKEHQRGRARSTRDLGFGQQQAAGAYDIGMRQSEATYALGMGQAASAYDIGSAAATADLGYATDVAGLGYERDIAGLKKAETGELHGMLAEFGGAANAWKDTSGTIHRTDGSKEHADGSYTDPSGTYYAGGKPGDIWEIEDSDSG